MPWINSKKKYGAKKKDLTKKQTLSFCFALDYQGKGIN